MKRLILILAILGLYVLHQDFWFWRSAGPFLFGFLPAALWYHAAFTIAVAVLMWLMVKFDWPAHLDPEQREDEKR